MRVITSFLLIVVFLIGCETDDLTAPDRFHSANDFASDVTAHGGSFYFTNKDDSGEPGDHVFLYRADESGTVVDLHNLHLNGQGYMSIASDGTFFYLLSEHPYGVLLKCTAVGEWKAVGRLSLAGWSWGGIAYRDDTMELIAALARVSHPDSVAFVSIDRNSLEVDTLVFRRLAGINGLFSLTWDSVWNRFYALGRDSSEQVQLTELDADYYPVDYRAVADTTRGLTALGAGELRAIGVRRSIFDLSR